MALESDTLHTVSLGDAELGYSDRGEGEPLLLVHAGVFADWFLPLSESPTLAGFRVIRVRRAGYGGRSPAGHLTLQDHARHAALLADRLGIPTLHWVGHSSSCLIGLQLAIDRPDLVHSLILLEPAPGGGLSGAAHAELQAALEPLTSADVGTAFEAFLRAVGGDDYREVIEGRLGRVGYERARRDAGFFFRDEMRAVWEWQFGAAEAGRVRQPTLIIEGGESYRLGPMNRQVIERAAALLPHAEVAAIAGVNHLMPLQDPEALAHVIASFVRRHPVAASRVEAGA